MYKFTCHCGNSVTILVKKFIVWCLKCGKSEKR